MCQVSGWRDLNSRPHGPELRTDKVGHFLLCVFYCTCNCLSDNTWRWEFFAMPFMNNDLAPVVGLKDFLGMTPTAHAIYVSAFGCILDFTWLCCIKQTLKKYTPAMISVMPFYLSTNQDCMVYAYFIGVVCTFVCSSPVIMDLDDQHVSPTNTSLRRLTIAQ